MTNDRLKSNPKKLEKLRQLERERVSKARSQARQKTEAEKRENFEKNKLSIGESLKRKLDLQMAGEKIALTVDEKKLARKWLQAAKLQREKNLKGNNLVKFCPNGAQEEVIKMIAQTQQDLKTPQIIADFAGNGRGKTALLINILGNIIWGNQPFIAKVGTLDDYTNLDSPVNWVAEWGDPPYSFFDYDIFKKWVFPKTIRIISTPANLDDAGAIQIEIDKWFPKHRFSGTKGKYDYRSKIVTDTGFTIEFKTYQMSPEEHESKTCGLILADEPMPQSIWGSTLSRFRRGGILLLSMTPLFGSAFLHDEIVQKADEGDKSIRYLFSDVEDNCVEHGIRGILTHEAVSWMISKYPPEERESRKSGSFLSLSGKIHKEFDRKIHVIPPKHDIEVLMTRDFILNNKHLFQFYQVIDPHDRKWDAVGYYAMDDRGRIYCFDEYPDRTVMPYQTLNTRRYTYKQLVEEVLLPKERGLGFEEGQIRRILDPRYAKNQSTRGASKTGRTIEQEFTEYYDEGFITNISDNFKACKNKLDNRLLIQTDGYPGIVYFENFADNHVYALEHWMWDRWEGKSAEKRDIKEKPQEKNSDFCRIQHYLVMYDPSYEIRDSRTIGWRDKLKKGDYTQNRKKKHSWLAF